MYMCRGYVPAVCIYVYVHMCIRAQTNNQIFGLIVLPLSDTKTSYQLFVLVCIGQAKQKFRV